jgi:protein-arginine kinase activator protein McsA
LEPIILHIEIGNNPIANWLKNNKYIIFSELLRFIKKMLEENLQFVQAILISNNNDNIVFILKKENLEHTLTKCMEYFLQIEEYEKCAEVRDLFKKL